MTRRSGLLPIDYKQEAIKALDQVTDRLAKGTSLSSLECMQLGATVQYARMSVTNIQELKRQRKQPTAAPPQGTPT